MKRVSKLLIAVSMITSLVYISSCTKEEEDPCAKVVCLNGGTCENGSCACPAGYEGDSCQTEQRAKFVYGNYQASESKNGGSAYTYQGSILTSVSNVQEIFINRIPNGTGFFNTNVRATVNGNALTIAYQNPDSDPYYIQGTGAYNSTNPGSVTFTYTVTGPDNNGNTITDSYTATWTKQ